MSEPSQPAARQPTPDCLIEGCPNPEKTRGLCGTCYATAAKTIKAGTLLKIGEDTVQVTWEWLEGQGLAKPTRKNTPKPTGVFAARIGAKMQELGATLVPLPLPVVPPIYQQSIPGPEAAHAASDGPPPPIAQTCHAPSPKQQPYKALIPVDPTTGQPYLQLLPPGQLPVPAQQPPAPMPTSILDGTPAVDGIRGNRSNAIVMADIKNPQVAGATDGAPAPTAPLPWQQ